MTEEHTPTGADGAPLEEDEAQRDSEKRCEELRERYVAAMHAIESGVKARAAMGDTVASPESLRVGVTSSQLDVGALGELLIAQGVIELEDYLEKLVEKAEQEVATHRERLGGIELV